MAAASGFGTSFSVNNCNNSDLNLKMDFCNASSIHNSSYSSVACISSKSRFFYDKLKVNKVFTEPRVLTLNPRCEVASGAGNGIKSKTSSLSALELLKTSAADRYTKEKSSFVVVGLDFNTTPIEIREKLSIPEAQWPQMIGELCSLNHIEEAAVLSTCNRLEIYVVALSQHRGVKEVTEWMSKISAVPVSELCQHRFLLHNKDAIQHLFEVSAGLKSLVVGESQILSQVKQVVKTGQGIPGFDLKISGLFKHAIRAGKRVRTETSISTRSVSVSSAAVELALMKLPESSQATTRMLVVGAGKMGKVVIKHLAAKGYQKIVVVNRTEATVTAIQAELKDTEIVYRPLSEMLACAAEADVVFSSTSSESILFSKELVQTLPPASPQVGGRRLFVDISVPRNVESHVSDLETAQVYNVDDLTEVVACNKEDRMQEAMEAQSIIEEEVKNFEAWKDSLETVPTVKKLKAYAEIIRASEVEKCLSKMGDSITEEQKKAICNLSAGIVDKLLHGPMKHLRCDEKDSRSLNEILENMHCLNRMFSLDTEIAVLEQKFRSKIEQKQK